MVLADVLFFCSYVLIARLLWLSVESLRAVRPTLERCHLWSPYPALVLLPIVLGGISFQIHIPTVLFSIIYCFTVLLVVYAAYRYAPINRSSRAARVASAAGAVFVGLVMLLTVIPEPTAVSPADKIRHVVIVLLMLLASTAYFVSLFMLCRRIRRFARRC